jgi:hypothetical protein
MWEICAVEFDELRRGGQSKKRILFLNNCIKIVVVIANGIISKNSVFYYGALQTKGSEKHFLC